MNEHLNTDDNYFAFADSADTEASQPAADITKCDLEVLQFLDDSKRDLEMMNKIFTGKEAVRAA